MDLKSLITHFTYHIEPKPDGGFIARAADPSLPPIEAPTRLELQQKIQQNISNTLAAEFPSLKLPLEQQQIKVAFHIERTPDGKFLIHSNDPNAAPDEAASHEIESKFAEKLLNFAGKHLATQLPPEFAAKMAAGDIKIFVDRKLAVGAGMPGPAGGEIFSSIASSVDAGTGANTNFGNTNGVNPTGGRISYANDSSPIKPATDSSWKFLRFLLALLVIAAIAYVFLRHH